MAGQGIFFRASTLFSNCRFLLNNRLPQFTQVSGAKQKAVDKLKELNIPEKPKKPLTPYFKFLSDHRKSIVAQHPEWKITQISSQCAADWKKIDLSTKEKYDTEYKTEMKQYTSKYLEYTNSLTDEQKAALKEYNQKLKKSKLKKEHKKKLRENDKPKRPMGAYMLYAKDQSKLQPNKNFIQLVTDLKENWAEMPIDEKTKYTDAAQKAKEQYDKDLLEWEQRMISEGQTNLVRQSTLKGKSPKPQKQE